MEEIMKFWTEHEIMEELGNPIIYESSDDSDVDEMEVEQPDDSDEDLDFVLGTVDLSEEEDRVRKVVEEFEMVEKTDEASQNNQGKSKMTTKRKRVDPETTVKSEAKKRKVSSTAILVKVEGDTVTGKNGVYKWFTEPQTDSGAKISHKNIVHVRSKPNGAATNALEPLECFKLFFDDEIISTILKYTNEAIYVKKTRYKTNSTTLRNLANEEILAFFGIIIFAGAMRNNHLSVDNLFNADLCGNKYRAAFSRSRLNFLIATLRFDCRQTRKERRKESRLASIKEIWDILVKNCRRNYEPSAYVTIDEQLVGFRGRCPFRMYMPHKQNKYGLKIVMMCDQATKYMCNALPYLGKGSTSLQTPLTDFVVERLVEDIRGTNRNVTFDNWFTSVTLTAKLLNEYELTSVGNIKKNKAELPEEFVDINYKDRPIGSSMFLFSSDATVVSYKPKSHKLVTLISTKHDDDSIIDLSGKPEIILDYNNTKGSVDKFDKAIQSTNCGRNTKRWPIALFYNMLNIVMYNSYIIYLHNFYRNKKSEQVKPLSRFQFLLKLVDQLLEPWLRTRYQQSLPNQLKEIIRSSLKIPVQEVPQVPQAEASSSQKRKYCSFCDYKKKRLSKMICSKCRCAVCGDHYNKVCVACYQ